MYYQRLPEAGCWKYQPKAEKLPGKNALEIFTPGANRHLGGGFKGF